jgi:glucokinase
LIEIIRAMPQIILAVDLGGTNIRMAAITADGMIRRQAKRPTPAALSPDKLLELTEELAGDCRRARTEKVSAIAFAPPANVGADGVIRNLPNLSLLDGLDLRSALEKRFGVPAIVENDATAAAIGESWLGASKGVHNSVMVTLGTGVGGGIIIDGKPLRGPDGGAGKIGHIAVEPDGHPCGCGSRGCVEQYASATAIERMAVEAGLATANSHEVFDAFLKGDERARAVFEKMGRYLGIMLGGLVNTLNPEVMVIGGGAAAAWDAFHEHTRREIDFRAFPEPARRARLVQSQLADNAGILGAARSAFLELENKQGRPK